jgi:hypothetical protein
LLPSLEPSQFALQTFTRFPMQPIPFFQLLHAPTHLRVSSPTVHQFVSLPRNRLLHPWNFVRLGVQPVDFSCQFTQPLLEICDCFSQIGIATILLRLNPSQLALQPFARFPKQPILFLQLLRASAQLRVPSQSFRQLAALCPICLPQLFVLALKPRQRFFQT